MIGKLCDAGSGNGSQEHLLTPAQLSEMGTLFLHILTTMKHNGAIDKTQAGFTSLVCRQALNPCICLGLCRFIWHCNMFGIDVFAHGSSSMLLYWPLHALRLAEHIGVIPLYAIA